MKYKYLFFDLDDTLWAFTENARDTFEELYQRYDYGRFFSSFQHFFSLYQRRNAELWVDYGKGLITKDELNRQRFSYPLQTVGVADDALAHHFATDFFTLIPTKQKLMPHTVEVLDYLRFRGYHLYILSNGFQELQCRKMRSAGIDSYFDGVILSDDIGILKPRPELFYYALSVAGAALEESLMIGDSWENDVAGAATLGMHQVYYAPLETAELPFLPTYQVTDLKELCAIL